MILLWHRGKKRLLLSNSCVVRIKWSCTKLDEIRLFPGLQSVTLAAEIRDLLYAIHFIIQSSFSFQWEEYFGCSTYSSSSSQSLSWWAVFLEHYSAVMYSHDLSGRSAPDQKMCLIGCVSSFVRRSRSLRTNYSLLIMPDPSMTHAAWSSCCYPLIYNLYRMCLLFSFLISASPFSVCVRGSKLDRVEVLCFRDRTLQGSRSIQHSLIFQIKLPELPLNSGKLHSPLCVYACAWGPNSIRCTVWLMVYTCVCTCVVFLDFPLRQRSAPLLRLTYLSQLDSYSFIFSIRNESNLNGNSRMEGGSFVICGFT